MTDNRTTEKLMREFVAVACECEVRDYLISEYVERIEQAIAATLGRQIDADLRKAIDFMRIWISEDAHLGESAYSRELEKAEGLRKLDAIEQAITATLGSGTCEMEYGGDITPDTAKAMGVYFCSECGSPIYNDCMPYFCGYCGKAVRR